MVIVSNLVESLVKDVNIFPYGFTPSAAVITSRLHDQYPRYGLSVVLVEKVSWKERLPRATIVLQRSSNSTGNGTLDSGLSSSSSSIASAGSETRSLNPLSKIKNVFDRIKENKKTFYLVIAVNKKTSEPYIFLYTLEHHKEGFSGDKVNVKLLRSGSRSSRKRSRQEKTPEDAQKDPAQSENESMAVLEFAENYDAGDVLLEYKQKKSKKSNTKRDKHVLVNDTKFSFKSQNCHDSFFKNLSNLV